MASSRMVDAAGPDTATDPSDERELGFVPDRTRRYTANEVRALNSANPRYWPRFECVGGQLLVTPAPTFRHQTVAERLFVQLAVYCDAQFRNGVPKFPPCDISWGGREHTVQPDVYVVPREMALAAWHRPDRSSTAGWREIRYLLLVAEVVSPSTQTHDRTVKRALYQRQGVPVYWIIDGAAQRVEAWTPDAVEAQVERERLVWHPEGAAVAFELPLATLFAPE